MSWLDKILPSRIRATKDEKGSVPEGLWHKCSNCGAVLYAAEFDKNNHVCPKCNHHERISARKRISIFLDKDNVTEMFNNLSPKDMLKFKDKQKYQDKFKQTQEKTGEKDALLVFTGSLKSIPVVTCVFEYSFFGGSMGSVVGEKFCRAVDLSIEQKRPLICFSASFNRPNHGRGVSKLGCVRRYQYCRTKCSNRFCWTTRDRTNSQRKITKRFSA